MLQERAEQSLVKEFEQDQLTIRIFPDSSRLGQAAAEFVAVQLNQAIERKGKAALILATGTSQFAMLSALEEKNVEWRRVTIFHLDEYSGLSKEHPASFRRFLLDRFLNFIDAGQIHFLGGDAADIEQEINRYTRLILAQEIDIACIGVGENGHLAFNDPPVADFADPQSVKIVELDEMCRMQQVGEGWFSTLRDVPTHALTLTIPAIMRSQVISCVVPELRKASAVRKMLAEPISTNCPASILRNHPHAVLWLDNDSSSLLSLMTASSSS